MGEWRNLWVNSETDQPLSKENRGVDYWSDFPDADLPPFYIAKSRKGSKTAIMLVTRDANTNPNGILLIELVRRVRISSALRYEDHVIKRDWKAMHNPGDIPKHITEEILSAKYGICYFSEVNNHQENAGDKKKSSLGFIDNSNFSRASKCPR